VLVPEFQPWPEFLLLADDADVAESWLESDWLESEEPESPPPHAVKRMEKLEINAMRAAFVKNCRSFIKCALRE